MRTRRRPRRSASCSPARWSSSASTPSPASTGPSSTACSGAARALASPPFLGTFTGHAMIEDAAVVAGYGWVPLVLAVATIASTAAIVRAGLRIFFGFGDRDDPLLSQQPTESGPKQDA